MGGGLIQNLYTGSNDVPRAVQELPCFRSRLQRWGEGEACLLRLGAHRSVNEGEEEEGEDCR